MIVKGRNHRSAKTNRVMANRAVNRRRRVMAGEDVQDFDDVADDATVEVAPEASELLFEAQDVAELVAEITEKPVEVTTDEDTVVFNVDGTEFTVEADGTEEVLESRRVRGRSVRASRAMRGARRPVRASRARRTERPVQASRTERRAVRRPVSASSRVERTERRTERPVSASSRVARRATERPVQASSVKRTASSVRAGRRVASRPVKASASARRESGRIARPASVRASRRISRAK